MIFKDKVVFPGVQFPRWRWSASPLILSLLPLATWARNPEPDVYNIQSIQKHIKSLICLSEAALKYNIALR